MSRARARWWARDSQPAAAGRWPCASRGARASADPQHDLAEDVAGLHALLRLCGLRQRELRGDRHLELHRFDAAVEALELLHPRDCVVADDLDAGARLRFGLDSVGERHLPAGSQGIDATLEGLAA